MVYPKSQEGDLLIDIESDVLHKEDVKQELGNKTPEEEATLEDAVYAESDFSIPSGEPSAFPEHPEDEGRDVEGVPDLQTEVAHLTNEVLLMRVFMEEQLNGVADTLAKLQTRIERLEVHGSTKVPIEMARNRLSSSTKSPPIHHHPQEMTGAASAVHSRSVVWTDSDLELFVRKNKFPALQDVAWQKLRQLSQRHGMNLRDSLSRVQKSDWTVAGVEKWIAANLA